MAYLGSSMTASQENITLNSNYSSIEEICKSVLSPYLEFANTYKDIHLQTLKERISVTLTASMMRARENKGSDYLEEWIRQVENVVTSDTLRVQMIRLKASQDVLSLVGLTFEELESITWSNVKSLLRSKATKPSVLEATNNLLTNVMGPDEDVWAFKASLHTKYINQCTALGVDNLKKTFEEILSFTMTSLMSDKSKFMYFDAIISDCETTLQELETNFQDPIKRKFLFNDMRYENQVTNLEYRPKDPSCTTSLINKPNMSPNILYDTPYENRQIKDSILSDDNKSMPLKSKDLSIKQTYEYSKTDICRPKITRKWNDWKCKTCSTTNSGHFHICSNCRDHATVRQTPHESWKCTKCPYGRNNWINYQFCSSCLEPNENVPYFKLRDRSKLTPFGRESTWSPILPIINP